MEVDGRLGVVPDGREWRATIWAPRATTIEVEFVDGDATPVRLGQSGRGYFSGPVGPRRTGERYWVRLDGARMADPASRAQPEGIHGPSALVDTSAFTWTDQGFEPPSQPDLVLYELHVGTFCAPRDPTAPGGRRPGSFARAASGLPAIAELGATAVEPMPIASFAGERNWGYDGVFLFAPQQSYGGPEGLVGFVDAAHAHGLAVVLDVVYNHLGPEGAVHERFGPYTSAQYTTPWGPAMNVDRAGSDGVRRHLLENARMWLVDYHVDGLRLDAIHGIVDTAAYPFLAELSEHVVRWSAVVGRPLLLIAESDDNNPRVLRSVASGGYGMDAQWADDFHHGLHVALTGERSRYYVDYSGTAEVTVALEQGFVFTGQYSSYRDRRHGAPPEGTEPNRYVICAQNHDQVGNRPGSERLATLVAPAALRVAAGVLCLAPQLPLLFMGEEHAEQAPFAYFVSHTDPDLVAAVREGRAAETGNEGRSDPGAPDTFAASCVDVGGGDRTLVAWYRALLEVRRRIPVVTDGGAETVATGVDGVVSLWRRGDQAMWCVGNTTSASVAVDVPHGRWRLALDSGTPEFGGGGPSLPISVDGPGPVSVGALSFGCYLEERHG